MLNGYPSPPPLIRPEVSQPRQALRKRDRDDARLGLAGALALISNVCAFEEFARLRVARFLGVNSSRW
ncbi:hypothetical protein AB1N83_003796 [Pleurotus pulmonarius]